MEHCCHPKFCEAHHNGSIGGIGEEFDVSSSEEENLLGEEWLDGSFTLEKKDPSFRGGVFTQNDEKNNKPVLVNCKQPAVISIKSNSTRDTINDDTILEVKFFSSSLEKMMSIKDSGFMIFLANIPLRN